MIESSLYTSSRIINIISISCYHSSIFSHLVSLFLLILRQSGCLAELGLCGEAARGSRCSRAGAAELGRGEMLRLRSSGTRTSTGVGVPPRGVRPKNLSFWRLPQMLGGTA